MRVVEGEDFDMHTYIYIKIHCVCMYDETLDETDTWEEQRVLL